MNNTIKKTQQQNLGLFMRIAVEGAIKIAQNEALNFERIPKVHYNGVDADLVTSADLKAQAYYEQLVHEYFPNDPLVGEEGKQAEAYKGARFTCDPVDGTKAYGRGQSTGVGTMFAHAIGDDVDAVCVGDVNTGEIYQYTPDHIPTRTRFGQINKLPTKWGALLSTQYALLNRPADDFPGNIRLMIRAKHGGIFKDMEVTSGSIGILVARLWKQEVAMVVIGASYDTPWDTTPIVGMNRALGIKHIRVHPETGHAEIFEAHAPVEVEKKDFVEILAHGTYADEIVEWLNSHKR
jgi:fructose-1,6-bisphosphatase/inositol monophosphatase family enzyme